MALNFLNNVDFSQNQILHTVIENQANDTLAGTGVDGQIYYNTTNKLIKVWDASASAWKPSGKYDDLTIGSENSGSNPDLYLYNGSDALANVTFTQGNGILTSGDGNSITIAVDYSDNATNVINAATTSTSVDDGDYVLVSDGSTGSASKMSLQTIAVSHFSSAEDNLNMNSNKIINVTDPTSNQDAATKNYVDSAVVGSLVYQGGYNAATNTPDLTTSPNSILKGWTYTVTTEGTFFGEQVRVGDVLIAEANDPSGLANWTTVQNNIDLASLTQIGIGNVKPTSDTDYAGVSVSYSSGTATVELDIESMITDNGDTSNDQTFVPYYDDGYVVNGKESFTNMASRFNGITTAIGSISAGNLTGTVTHSFGINTIVQTIDSSGDTVYCDVSRTATTCVATVASTQATAITILVQKIG